jgi:Carbohydrate-binding family 9
VIIPVTLFADYDLDRFDGQLMRANLYKCGDRLTKPHYATWNPVVSQKPDYHRPESFGEWIFQ